MTLGDSNSAPRPAVREALLACCGSESWVDRMLQCRPFASAEHLYEEAEKAWRSLSPDDWLQAFASHPEIGESSAGRWSSQEQQGVAQSDRNTMKTIRELNTQYRSRFGYIFIICATGKSAEEVRVQLAERLTNEPAMELQTAAAEQAKITRLRLEKLLAG